MSLLHLLSWWDLLGWKSRNPSSRTTSGAAVPLAFHIDTRCFLSDASPSTALQRRSRLCASGLREPYCHGRNVHHIQRDHRAAHHHAADRPIPRPVRPALGRLAPSLPAATAHTAPAQLGFPLSASAPGGKMVSGAGALGPIRRHQPRGRRAVAAGHGGGRCGARCGRGTGREGLRAGPGPGVGPAAEQASSPRWAARGSRSYLGGLWEMARVRGMAC